MIVKIAFNLYEVHINYNLNKLKIEIKFSNVLRTMGRLMFSVVQSVNDLLSAELLHQKLNNGITIIIKIPTIIILPC